MDYTRIENLMRPRAYSNKGFLGPTERLDKILKADDETVRKLGLTHDQIANRMEYFISAVNSEPKREGVIVDNYYKVSGTHWLGMQNCPWKNECPTDRYSIELWNGCLDMVVENLKTDESIKFPGLIVHLIREHHFYEGKESPYRVDPEKAARVLDIKKS